MKAAIIAILLVAAGFYSRVGAVFLVLFLVPVTFYMHNFWTIDEAKERTEQMINFMKNVAIAGGIMLVLAFGAGPWSIDARRQTAPTVVS